MSTVLHPVGPSSPGVYWFRRVLVLIVVVALLLGVRWLLTGRGDGGSSAAGPTASPSATPSPSPSTTAKPSTSPTTKPSGSSTAKPSTSPTGGAVATCKDSAITVTASTDAASYPVGSTPRLRMRIQNTSDTACKRDVGAAANELLITSGSARVWSSDDCNSGGSQQIATLQPGQSYSVSVTWLGRLSAKGCPADEPLAQKGSYKLVGRNGDVTSEPAVFALT
ncbi:MAG: hypothetical protein U0S36_06715 [Candidatus Nanopelagicales bacterium]